MADHHKIGKTKIKKMLLRALPGEFQYDIRTVNPNSIASRVLGDLWEYKAQHMGMGDFF